MGRKYPLKDLKLLWGLSAGRCAFPNCKQICIATATSLDAAATIGQIAHIYAHSDGGPRSNPTLPQDDRDKYDNWILLCSTHHDLVDSQHNTYTVEQLVEWRNDHERWVEQSLTKYLPSVGFAELEIVTQSLINAPIPSYSTIDFTLVNPAQKISKNNLTHRTYHKITMGLSKAREVQDFVEQLSTIDASFPNRLKTSFVTEYERLRHTGVTVPGN